MIYYHTMLSDTFLLYRKFIWKKKSRFLVASIRLARNTIFEHVSSVDDYFLLTKPSLALQTVTVVWGRCSTTPPRRRRAARYKRQTLFEYFIFCPLNKIASHGRRLHDQLEYTGDGLEKTFTGNLNVLNRVPLSPPAPQCGASARVRVNKIEANTPETEAQKLCINKRSAHRSSDAAYNMYTGRVTEIILHRFNVEISNVA